MRYLLGLLLAASCWATTLSGTLNIPNGVGASGNLIFSLSQQGALATSCGGPIEIVPTSQVVVPVVNGAMSGTPFLYGNDCINPQGTFYNVQFVDINSNVLFTDRWVITGSSINIGTIVSAVISGTTQSLGTTGVVYFSPTGNQVVNQPAGTALSANFFTVTGTFTFPSGASCNAGGCTGLDTGTVTLGTAQTISGQKTFTASPLFSGVDVGSGAFPANYGWFNSAVYTNLLRFGLGSVGSPTDFFYIKEDSLHRFGIYNSVNTEVLIFADSTGPGAWLMTGSVTSTVGFQSQFISGSDVSCSGATGGIFTIRTDLSPPVLETCIANVLHTLPFAN